MLWWDAISSSSTCWRDAAGGRTRPDSTSRRSCDTMPRREMTLQEFERQPAQHPVLAVQRAERHLQRLGRQLRPPAG